MEKSYRLWRTLLTSGDPFSAVQHDINQKRSALRFLNPAVLMCDGPCEVEVVGTAAAPKIIGRRGRAEQGWPGRHRHRELSELLCTINHFIGKVRTQIGGGARDCSAPGALGGNPCQQSSAIGNSDSVPNEGPNYFSHPPTFHLSDTNHHHYHHHHHQLSHTQPSQQHTSLSPRLGVFDSAACDGILSDRMPPVGEAGTV